MRARTSCLKCLRSVIVLSFSGRGGEGDPARPALSGKPRSEGDGGRDTLEDRNPLYLRGCRTAQASGQEVGREEAPGDTLLGNADSGKWEATKPVRQLRAPFPFVGELGDQQ